MSSVRRRAGKGAGDSAAGDDQDDNTGRVVAGRERGSFANKCTCVIAVLATIALVLLFRAGELRRVEDEGLSRCSRVASCHECEDLQLDSRDGGTSLIGTTDIHGWLHPDGGKASLREAIALQKEQGGIVAVDAGATEARDVPLNDFPHTDFHPHGLYLHKGRDQLFVVNHRREGDAIEVFDAPVGATKPGGSGLGFVRSITASAMININDVVVTPDGSTLYTSMWMRNAPGTMMAKVEGLSRAPLGAVVGCDLAAIDGGASGDDACSVVASGIAMPNGMNVSPDGSRVYVVSTLDAGLHVFSRTQGTALQPAGFQRLHTFCDNLDIDAAGNAYTACHPKLFTWVEHASHHRVSAPSEVLMWRGLTRQREAGTIPQFEVIMVDSSGKYINGSTVAAADASGQRVLLGSITDDELVACYLPQL